MFASGWVFRVFDGIETISGVRLIVEFRSHVLFWALFCWILFEVTQEKGAGRGKVEGVCVALFPFVCLLCRYLCFVCI